MGDELVEGSSRRWSSPFAETGREVVLAVDLMHGNTFVASAGQKTRRFYYVLSETSKFFELLSRWHVAGWPARRADR